jgi:hypothetical protein
MGIKDYMKGRVLAFGRRIEKNKRIPEMEHNHQVAGLMNDFNAEFSRCVREMESYMIAFMDQRIKERFKR